MAKNMAKKFKVIERGK